MDLLAPLLQEIRTLSAEGGWVFRALVLLAFAIAFALLSLWRATRLPDAPLLAPREWLALLSSRSEHPELIERLRRRLGPREQRAARLREAGARLFAAAERRFPFTFVMIGAAPLIGLLGTVSGMFKTFRGMAVAAVAAPIDVISSGISEALITTQTGLVIGVPTYIVCAWLKSRHEQLVLAFGKIESRLLQPPAPPQPES